MRRCQFLCLGGFLLVCVTCGCNSNNKGKLEGTKWNSEDTVAKGIHVPAGTVFLNFSKDGKLMGRFGNFNLSGKYELGWGDRVTLHLDQALSNGKVHTETIVIKGSRMTMTDPDGTQMTFRKWQ